MLKDYDCTILYQLTKINVVVDALSSLAHITPVRKPLVEDTYKLEQEGVHFDIGKPEVLLAREGLIFCKDTNSRGSKGGS